MNALAVIRTEKVVVEAGAWHSGKIDRAAFPLSHVKGGHKLAKNWHWCVQQLADDARAYRLLVAFEPGKRQFWAWLGVPFGDDQAVVARVEFHHSHDGWHCHWKTGPLVEVGRGAVKAAFPKERRRHCGGGALDLNKAEALSLAHKLFDVQMRKEEGLV